MPTKGYRTTAERALALETNARALSEINADRDRCKVVDYYLARHKEIAAKLANFERDFRPGFVAVYQQELRGIERAIALALNGVTAS